MKNNPLITLLLLLIIITALVSAAELTTHIILGYTGFQNINSKPNSILLSIQCTNPYFISKYINSLHISLKISCCCAIITTIISITTLFALVCFLCSSKKVERRRDETGIQGLSKMQNARNIYRNELNPTQKQIIIIYLLLALLTISSFIIFKQFIQYLAEQNNNTCPIQIRTAEILAITIMSGVIMVASIAAIILLFAIICKKQKRLKMLQMENHSQSFRHQMERIIRQSPQSQRYFQRNQNDLISDNNKQENPPKSRNILSQSSGREDLQLQNMKKVESIIYNPQPQLMLQSIINSP